MDVVAVAGHAASTMEEKRTPKLARACCWECARSTLPRIILQSPLSRIGFDSILADQPIFAHLQARMTSAYTAVRCSSVQLALQQCPAVSRSHMFHGCRERRLAIFTCVDCVLGLVTQILRRVGDPEWSTACECGEEGRGVIGSRERVLCRESAVSPTAFALLSPLTLSYIGGPHADAATVYRDLRYAAKLIEVSSVDYLLSLLAMKRCK